MTFRPLRRLKERGPDEKQPGEDNHEALFEAVP
jgi:hypothetical protein